MLMFFIIVENQELQINTPAQIKERSMGVT